MLKQTSTPTPGNYWPFVHLHGQWNALAGLGMLYKLLPARRSLLVDDATSAERDLLPMMCLRVVRNINSFERELL